MWAMHGEERESLGTCVAGLYLVVSVCVYDCVCMCIGNAQSKVGELNVCLLMNVYLVMNVCLCLHVRVRVRVVMHEVK